MTNEALSDRKPVFVSRIPIRWGDMDAMGHVNNTVFFRYMEQARIEWYSHIGRGKRAGTETIVVHCYCTYYVQLTYPGEIEIRTYACSPGRSSFKIIQEIRRSDNLETVCAVGGATVVFIDPNTRKSTPIPQMMRELMTP